MNYFIKTSCFFCFATFYWRFSSVLHPQNFPRAADNHTHSLFLQRLKADVQMCRPLDDDDNGNSRPCLQNKNAVEPPPNMSSTQNGIVFQHSHCAMEAIYICHMSLQMGMEIYHCHPVIIYV